MLNIDSRSHVRGESVFLDDIPVVEGTLYACVADARVAHGRLRGLDVSRAVAAEGVVRVITANDLRGENQIGGVIPDEPLLVSDTVHFQGMPLAIVLAHTEQHARAAAAMITADIEPLEPVTDAREACRRGLLIAPPKQFVLGDTAAAFARCAHVFEGRTETGGQEHLYLETQGAYVLPAEHGGLRVYSSTQGPTAVQKAVSRVTAIPMHKIEVDVARIGGGFGGKEDQANVWAAICAVGAQLAGRPVKYALHRAEDLRMTGKRHPYSADFRIGLDANRKILAYEVTFFQNAGATADLSLAVLERTLFHCTNAYHVPNVRATAYSCRTNLPSNTAFRGFGGPQAMFVMESAIAHAAEQLGIEPWEIQRANLLADGDVFPYGQTAESEASRTWEEADRAFDFAQLRRDATEFNASHPYTRKGVAVMPICFGISFTKTLMNQARAHVHVYLDGSVAVSTGAVEMGQGVNTKIAQVAARVFALPAERIRVHSTNTLRVANTSPTAASAAADLNGKATAIACEQILGRLKAVAVPLVGARATEDITLQGGMVYRAGEPTEVSWTALLAEAYAQRVSLSEHAHYATPGIGFDWSIGKGAPFAYHVYGTAIVGVTVDCLRGIAAVDYVRCCHDFGESMSPDVDLGQVEGGIVQGLGWMTMEEVVYNGQGMLQSDALSTYKVPDIHAVPRDISVLALDRHRPNLAILNSKAVGEPPLMYGIGAFFAIRAAIRAFRADAQIPFTAPMTHERVLLAACR